MVYLLIMKTTHIPFAKTGFFSKMMLDYLDKDPKLHPYYKHFPDLEGFENQIKEKEASFDVGTRKVLSTALKAQYQNFEISDKTSEHITLLAEPNTFTITTGHQLNLFTGPLYFLYKIISTINLCEELAQQFPQQNFVPMYWMATEDHDFEEINYFNFEGKKVSWNSAQSGAVGRFSTEGLQDVFEAFSAHLNSSKNADFIRNLFSDAYLKQSNLADATRHIANELFGEYGLVIVDGDDKQLKELFIPFVEDELQNNTSFTEVSKTIKELEKEYGIQVNPRPINLFYLGDNFRERIVEQDGVYTVLETTISWTLDEILKELRQFPTRFSPNVIMRPLYQEVILPNLCYIGGGGEQAYWLELKGYFEKQNIPFPILLLRNSVQLVATKQQEKLTKLGITTEELFLRQHQLLAKKIVENSDIKISFKAKKEFLKEQFVALREVAAQTDKSFINAVAAQEKKQLNGLDMLEKRLLRAEKRKHNDLVARITLIQNELLPNQSLEERQRNFSEFYIAHGAAFIEALKTSLLPLQLEFTVLEL